MTTFATDAPSDTAAAIKTLRIKGWTDDIFLKRDAVRGKSTPPPWVAIPTGMDGLGMRRLANTDGGAEAYGVFIMLVALVARLDRDNGTLVDGEFVLDAERMSARTGFPVAAFERAIPILERVGWLLAADSPHVAADLPQAAAATEHGAQDLAPTRTRTRTLLPPSATGEKAKARKAATAKKPGARKPNPIWDTLAELFFPSGVAEGDQSRLGKLARDLKAKSATPDSIREHLEVYRSRWPKMTATPEALVKHWDVLAPEQTEFAKAMEAANHG